MTESTALERPSATQLVPTYLDEFALVLPSHVKPETFVQVAIGALRKNAQLMEAANEDPGSLVYALRDAARLGLQPGTEQFWLTPRRVKGKWTVLGIAGYEGEIELMYRAGAVDSVIVEAVHAKDTFTYTPGRDARPVHEVDWFNDRGDVVLAYSYAVMKGGATSKVCVVTQARIDRAMKASPTADKDFSPWKSDPAAMWMKTAAHDLAKWVPTSAEYLREQLRAVADVAAEPRGEQAGGFLPPQPGDVDLPVHDAETGEVVEGTLVEDWPPVSEPPS